MINGTLFNPGPLLRRCCQAFKEGCSRLLVGLLGLAAFVCAADSASAVDNCLRDLSNLPVLTCAASDVEIATFNVLNGVTECVTSENVMIQLQADLVAQADERYDIGFFVALDGGDAFTGMCHHDYLPPPLSTAATPANTTRTSPFFNAESVQDPDDTCGDIEKDVNTLRDLPVLSVPCVDQDNNGFLDVAACTTWSNVRLTTCTSVDDTLPNTPAKCRCELINSNISVKGQIIIKKETFGGDAAFTFTPSWGMPPSFNLSDGQMHESIPLSAGNYSVTETVLAGWDLVSMACDDGSVASNISLQTGEVVTCTFNNVIETAGCSTDCNDNIACTIDFCNESLVCQHTPDNGLCNNGQFCDGAEICDRLQGCVDGPDPNCSDDIDCTDDICFEPMDECLHMPDDALCNDNQFCDGEEICDPLNNCLDGVPINCEDDDNCTEDLCDITTDQCAHVPHIADRDRDGTPDCKDQCPDNPNRTQPPCHTRGHGGGASGFYVPVIPPPPGVCPLECLSVNALDQLDADLDGIVDFCDNWPLMPNGFEDLNGDGIADVCEDYPIVPVVPVVPIVPGPDLGIGIGALDKAPAPGSGPVPSKIEDSGPTTPTKTVSSCSSLGFGGKDLSVWVIMMALFLRLISKRRMSQRLSS